MKKLVILMIWSILAGFSSSQLEAKPRIKVRPWLRLPNEVRQMAANSIGDYLAITYTSVNGLWVLDVASKKIKKISRGIVPPHFFWSPDGSHLIYQVSLPEIPETSSIMIYDTNTQKHRDVGATSTQKNHFALEPIDQSIWIWSTKGLSELSLKIPDMPKAPWQKKLTRLPERYLTSTKGIFILDKETQRLERLDSKLNPSVASADISPDGTSVVWGDKTDRIYGSERFSEPLLLSYGRDPIFHMRDSRIIFSSARRVGVKTVGYDLALIGKNRDIKNITRTDLLDEKLPTLLGSTELIFTADRTTDLYRIKF